MPPRKAEVPKVTTGDEGTPAKEASGRDGINIEDLNLPKSIVTRLAKGVLPPNTQIQGNAMLAMTKSATVFVNYLASHANEHTQQQTRKTIAPQDVFQALDDLEFSGFRERLESELAKFIELQTDKRNTYRKRVAADKASGKNGSPQPPEGEESYVDGDGGVEGLLDRDGQPVAKKARIHRVGDRREGDMMHDTQPDSDEGENDEGQGDDPEDDEEEEEQEDRLDPEEQLDDPEQREAEDEALDSGEDSD